MSGVALVTGASRGIGRAAAVALAEAGWDVVLNFARNEAAALECQDLCRKRRPGGRFELCQADVAVRDDRLRLVDFADKTFGRVDCLVNNAGVAPEKRVDLLDATEDSFDRLVATNLKGPYFLTALVARRMIDLAASHARSIITISSISAYAASINRGDYCVSKAGLSMLTALFAARLAEHRINVYEIRPGVIRTDMTAPIEAKYDKLIAEGLTPIRRWGTPEDVGRAVAAVAGGALPFSTGEVINVDGGFHLRTL